jgi:putative ABC transport system permease protein
MPIRTGLLAEIITMALGTLRANKLRSFLTILGVVIGVTSIVGMTSLVRGFGDQLEALVRQLGSNTVIVSQFSIASMSAGKSFLDLLKRPNLTEEDAAAIKDLCPSVGTVAMQLGGGPTARMERVTHRNESTKSIPVVGATSNFGEINYIPIDSGRGFTDFEVERRRHVVMLGFAPAQTLFPSTDPLGKTVRIGKNEFTVIGTFGQRPGVLGGNPDEFAVIPFSTYDKLFPAPRFRGYLLRFVMIMVSPREGYTQEQMIGEIESIIRARHRLRLDQENDFDLVTADSILGILNQFTRAIFLALIVISSIALMVGGIGVMAIMTISVTERTREIGVRKALGARRREILVQFLIEAVVLTSIGGILGILLGSAIGYSVNVFAGFPVSLPWWSFALGLGFSSLIGIFFGMWPAMKASRLDPIEALRYE